MLLPYGRLRASAVGRGWRQIETHRALPSAACHLCLGGGGGHEVGVVPVQVEQLLVRAALQHAAAVDGCGGVGASGAGRVIRQGGGGGSSCSAFPAARVPAAVFVVRVQQAQITGSRSPLKPAILSQLTIVERRCATTNVVRPACGGRGAAGRCFQPCVVRSHATEAGRLLKLPRSPWPHPARPAPASRSPRPAPPWPRPA